MKWLGMALCVIAALGGWITARAAERVEDTVVVTASRVEESARTVPQSMTVIGPEELDKNQYENMAQLLQAYGFSIDSYGPSQTTSSIYIRGQRSDFSNPLDSNVLVLVNGAPIATTNLSMIPMDGIERVEVLKGAGAVQYGSSAMGGVINIIPKRGGEEFHLSAEAGGGTWNSWRALGSLSGQYKFFDFAGAVTWNRQGSNYTTGKGDLYSDTEAQSRLNYLLNFGVNFNEENRLGALIIGANDWGLGMNSNLQEEEINGGLDNKLKHINSSVNVTYDGGYEPSGLSWKFRYFNAYEQSNFEYGLNPANNSQLDITQAGGQGQVSWNWEFLTLTGGVDYTESGYSQGYNPRYTQTNTAGFFMAKLSFMDEFLVLTGGLRYDDYTFKVNGNTKDLNNTSFSGGVALNPWDWLTLRASFGESYKVPSGLYVIGYEGLYNKVEGNSDLQPEKGYGWDVGFDVRYRGLGASLTYFSTIYSDKFLYETLPNYSIRYYNGEGTSYYNGFEGQVSFDLGEFFEWDFALRPYLNFTKLLNFNDDNGNRYLNVRDFVAAFGVNFNYPEWGLEADLRFTYLGYQNEYDFNTDYPYKKIRTGGKTVGDFFISKTIYDFEDGGKFTLKAEVRNFTNENYAYRHDYPLPGRSFYIGVRYDF